MWDVISVVEKPQIHMLQVAPLMLNRWCTMTHGLSAYVFLTPQLTQPWEYLSQTL